MKDDGEHRKGGRTKRLVGVSDFTGLEVWILSLFASAVTENPVDGESVEAVFIGACARERVPKRLALL
ncbi:MAG: hypothetical protein ACI9TH_001643 [Kiritimatiellia bacterium]|jgi:hypothetical protein